MTAEDAAARWEQWSVRGDRAKLDKVIEGLNAGLPGDWKPIEDRAEFADLLRRTKLGTSWYAVEPAGSKPGVVAGIEMRGDTELKGGRVWFRGPDGHRVSPEGVEAVWALVNSLLDEGIGKAASDAGAEARIPTADGVFLGRLPFEAANRLERFSDRARKQFPLDREEAGLWHEFVVAAYRGHATVDARAFAGWLAGRSWPEVHAHELALRFLDNSSLLSHYVREAVAV